MLHPYIVSSNGISMRRCRDVRCTCTLLSLQLATILVCILFVLPSLLHPTILSVVLHTCCYPFFGYPWGKVCLCPQVNPCLWHSFISHCCWFNIHVANLGRHNRLRSNLQQSRHDIQEIVCVNMRISLYTYLLAMKVLALPYVPLVLLIRYTWSDWAHFTQNDKL